MASNSFGQLFRLTSFGESHGPAIGGVIDGCPAGLLLDESFIAKEMGRRKAGSTTGSTTRKEADQVEILSGVFEGHTTGTPIAFVIRNKDHRSADYEHLKNSFRPSHADYTYEKKYGVRDYRGGGRASARETAIRVAAGAIAKLLLRQWDIRIHGYVSQIGSIAIRENYTSLDFSKTNASPVRCPDPETSKAMEKLIDEMRQKGDTLGGVITCVSSGVPAGLGEPVYDKLEAELGKAILGINAVKGFTVGAGIEAAKSIGSELNDRFISKGDAIQTATNHSGGIQGGISNGEDIWFRAYFKPVATLMQDQETVDRKGNRVVLSGKGRHDVCVVPRAIPIVEAMTAITLADFILRNRSAKI
jgi:chorismate synthase